MKESERERERQRESKIEKGLHIESEIERERERETDRNDFVGHSTIRMDRLRCRYNLNLFLLQVCIFTC